jgi:hypothetical protein
MGMHRPTQYRGEFKLTNYEIKHVAKVARLSFRAYYYTKRTEVTIIPFWKFFAQ